jgi:hypothetical protein
VQVGDTVRNKLTGKVYRLREIKRTVAIVQRGSTAISLRIENVEVVKPQRKV